jgi:F0F1-type ATP synthase assembly protein I
LHFIGILCLWFFRNNEFTSFIRAFVFVEIISFVFNILLLLFIVKKYEDKTFITS